MKMLFFIFSLTITLTVSLIIVSSQEKATVRIEKPIGNLNAQEVSVDSNQEFLTLERIFSKDKILLTRNDSSLRTVVITGDVIPARSVNTSTLRRNDFTWAYAPTASFVADGDITFIDLETPLLTLCPRTDEGFVFCGDARHIQGLLLLGTDVATLANNHAGNYGEEGVRETIRHLGNAGISATGANNNPVYKDVRGMTFAFLGYNDIETRPFLSSVDEEVIQKEVREAKKSADIVIVQFHWGEEYTSQPTERQRKFAHLSIDSGADLVVGNHPHWIQPVEIYNGKVITYAHGNFIFDQMWSQKTMEGVVGKYTFRDKQLVDITFTPINIVDYGQAHIITDEVRKKRILHEMYQESKTLASRE